MSVNPKKRRKRTRQSATILSLVLCILFIILVASLLLLVMQSGKQPKTGSGSNAGTVSEGGAVSSGGSSSQNEREASVSETESEEALSEAFSETATEPETEDDGVLDEEDVYTFLQGPKAWKSKTDWSGAWCNVTLAYQYFSVFGCGHCDLASIYSTLTPYDCSPLDMYEYSQKASKYDPEMYMGSIDWPDLKQTLKTVGIESKLCRKDKTYEQFCESIASGLTAIVLVSSYNDDTYWHNVEGHYVHIWLYDPEDGTVLLGDSGNPDHNRQRIPLKYIYDALKTGSTYQYLLVTSVNESANAWKHDGINIPWTMPKYYKGRSTPDDWVMPETEVQTEAKQQEEQQQAEGDGSWVQQDDWSQDGQWTGEEQWAAQDQWSGEEQWVPQDQWSGEEQWAQDGTWIDDSQWNGEGQY